MIDSGRINLGVPVRLQPNCWLGPQESYAAMISSAVAWIDLTRRDLTTKARLQVGWLTNQAIRSLDRLLRHCYAVHEYTDDPECIFRVALVLLEATSCSNTERSFGRAMPSSNCICGTSNCR